MAPLSIYEKDVLKKRKPPAHTWEWTSYERSHSTLSPLDLETDPKSRDESRTIISVDAYDKEGGDTFFLGPVLNKVTGSA